MLQSMSYQTAIRSSTHPCIQAGHDIPELGIHSQEPVKALKTAPAQITQSLTNRPSCTTVLCMHRA